MATNAETVEFILAKLGTDSIFRARAMFGEYALYANDKVVALICDDTLFVKILPASAELDTICEKGEPYPGAKSHYVVDESLLTTFSSLPHILIDIAASLPKKKQRMKSAKKKST